MTQSAARWRFGVYLSATANAGLAVSYYAVFTMVAGVGGCEV